MNKIEELKKELEAKKTRLDEINAITDITDKFIVVYDSNNRKIEFRISDGMEKGKRSDSAWSKWIDVQGAIAAYNLHNGIAND